jgi:hypothetical protein
MTFSDLLGAVVHTATSGVVAGSRRNALGALESRYQVSRDSRDVMLALTAAVSPASGPASQRRSA